MYICLSLVSGILTIYCIEVIYTSYRDKKVENGRNNNNSKK